MPDGDMAYCATPTFDLDNQVCTPSLISGTAGRLFVWYKAWGGDDVRSI